jgi:hypothetical protein
MTPVHDICTPKALANQAVAFLQFSQVVCSKRSPLSKEPLRRPAIYNRPRLGDELGPIGRGQKPSLRHRNDLSMQNELGLDAPCTKLVLRSFNCAAPYQHRYCSGLA